MTSETREVPVTYFGRVIGTAKVDPYNNIVEATIDDDLIPKGLKKALFPETQVSIGFKAEDNKENNIHG